MRVKIVEKGCPICGGEVRGNVRDKYFCKSCNLLFRSKQLNPDGKIKGLVSDDGKVLERFSDDSD